MYMYMGGESWYHPQMSRLGMYSTCTCTCTSAIHMYSTLHVPLHYILSKGDSRVHMHITYSSKPLRQLYLFSKLLRLLNLSS